MDPTGKPRSPVASNTPSPSRSSATSSLSAAPSSPLTSSSSAGVGSTIDHAGSPTTPARTGPLSDDQLTGWDGGPNPTTALREYDAPEGWELPRGTKNAVVEWELPRGTKQFTLGESRDCDIAIRGRGLSATHCLLVRRADKIRLYDLHSTHGTYVRDYKITDADINPGDTFMPRPITLVAMDDAMRSHRPTLVEILGTGARPSPDWLMIQAARSQDHVLITGEPGCEHERLAREIHAISLRRTRSIIELATIPADRAEQIATLKQASKTKTTVVLTIAVGQAPLDPTFSSMLYSASYGLRVLVLAPDTEVARRALTEQLVSKMQHVPLRRLAQRTAEIGHLLDRMLMERQATQRTADLTRANQEALQTYDWSGNLAELRQIAEGMAAHAALGGLRPAGKALGRPYQTLQKHFARVGLMFPLFG
jgi:FHA domain